jgi:8-oxo-dGTP pyrophosphatase MutT (NUDIX family)
MTQRVNHSSTPPLDAFLERIPPLLLPKNDWGYFRPGAKPAAVAFILYTRDGDWHVPFVLRRPDLPSHPGQVGLPGGGVEPGEAAWQAAAREAEEEIGVRASELVWLGSGQPLYAAVTNFSVVPFVAWLPGDHVRFVAEPGELEGVLEVPLNLLLDSSSWLEGGRPWPGRHLPFQRAIIWGLTARLLEDLLPPIEAALRG